VIAALLPIRGLLARESVDSRAAESAASSPCPGSRLGSTVEDRIRAAIGAAFDPADLRVRVSDIRIAADRARYNCRAMGTVDALPLPGGRRSAEFAFDFEGVMERHILVERPVVHDAEPLVLSVVESRDGGARLSDVSSRLFAGAPAPSNFRELVGESEVAPVAGGGLVSFFGGSLDGRMASLWKATWVRVSERSLYPGFEVSSERLVLDGVDLLWDARLPEEDELRGLLEEGARRVALERVEGGGNGPGTGWLAFAREWWLAASEIRSAVLRPGFTVEGDWTVLLTVEVEYELERRWGQVDCSMALEARMREGATGRGGNGSGRWELLGSPRVAEDTPVRCRDVQ
jgi:hypothetical protein